MKCQERGIPFGTLVKVPCDFGCLVEIEYGPGIFGWAQELLGFTKEICLAQQAILLTMLLVPFYLLNCKERSELCKYYHV